MENMETLMVILLVLAFAGVGMVAVFLGLGWLHRPAVTPANREETARGLFDHFMKVDGVKIVDGKVVDA